MIGQFLLFICSLISYANEVTNGGLLDSLNKSDDSGWKLPLQKNQPCDKGVGVLNWVILCQPTGFPGSSDSKESACNVGDLGSTPGLGRFPG